jgi:hypothetical protein
MFSKYDSNSSLLQKFVYITGFSDYLVGSLTWVGAIVIATADTPVTGQVVPLVTLGTFLMMAAACLTWASEDMINRAPVIFWQGLVRLSAISAVIYSVPKGLAETFEYVLIFIDGPIGLTYVIGTMVICKAGPIKMLLCRLPAQESQPAQSQTPAAAGL